MKHVLAAIIDSGWGDSGKGLLTDLLSHKSTPDDTSNTLVVRYCSGAQAGHTVTLPDGRRHVFHHFGSGSCNGAATFLSQYFITNPILFNQEYQDLLSVGVVSPTIFIDRRSIVTTPFDMILNQAIESKRGKNRHGSCGLGINSTVDRNLRDSYSLTVSDLYQYRDSSLATKLYNIRDNYFYPMAQHEEVDVIDDVKYYLESDDIIKIFIAECRIMQGGIPNTPKDHYWNTKLIENYDHIIFEGAQGLRLDEDHSNYPHVTRAKTGLCNIVKMLKEVELTEPLDVYYVTRQYLTKHGAGPFKNELALAQMDMLFDISDETNIYNPHQGSLRFALLDLDDLFKEIQHDIDSVSGIEINKNIVITCLDQSRSGTMYYYKDGFPVYGGDPAVFLNYFKDAGFKILGSWGSTRDDVDVLNVE